MQKYFKQAEKDKERYTKEAAAYVLLGFAVYALHFFNAFCFGVCQADLAANCVTDTKPSKKEMLRWTRRKQPRVKTSHDCLFCFCIVCITRLLYST